MIENLKGGLGAIIIVFGTLFIIYVYQSLKDLNKIRRP